MTLEETHNRALAELRARHQARKELEAKRAAVTEPENVAQRSIRAPQTQECPNCAAEIPLRAVKCKYCGEFVDEDFRPKASSSAPAQVQVHIHGKERHWSPGVAAVLSFFIPGLGQIYKGQIFNGLFWLIITALGYACFIFPGIFLHLLCILGAASGDPYRS
jgi:ribosomal protein L40E